MSIRVELDEVIYEFNNEMWYPISGRNANISVPISFAQKLRRIAVLDGHIFQKPQPDEKISSKESRKKRVSSKKKKTGISISSLISNE